jgi:hypothetical protein
VAIFDANRVQNLTFYIVLDDAERVAELNAQYPDGVNLPPYVPGPPEGGASIDYDAPWIGLASPGAHLPPYSYTDWPSSPSKPFPTDVHTFSRHTGGFLGIGGTTVRYYWIAKFVYMPNANVGNDEAGVPSWAATPAKLFLEGFETPGRGAAVGNVGEYCITDASRHVGGRGLAVRGQTSATYSLAPTSSGATPFDVKEQWDRLYIRLRKLPTATSNFWRYSTTPSAGVGHVLGVTASGGIAIFSSNSSSVLSLVTVISGFELEVWNGLASHDVWCKVDIVYKVGAGGVFRLYLNGEQVYSGATPSGPTAIVNSSVGAPGQNPNDLELDIDDWSAANWPRKGGDFYVSKDFLNGTKIALIRPTEFNAGAGWTGNVRVLAQNAFGFVPAELTSSTSGALVQVDTDSTQVVDNDPGAAGYGATAIQVQAYSKRGGAPSGSLGYNINGAGAVDTAVTQSASLGGNSLIYSTETAEDEDPFEDVTPVILRHTKAADATAATIASLNASVELVGKFTTCDYRDDEQEALGTDPSANLNLGTGPHNTPYPRTPWAKRGLAPPIGTFIVHAGTYTGNGTGQDLIFRQPVHWLWIRPTSGAFGGGTFWLSAGQGSHTALQTGIYPGIAHAEADPAFTPADGEDVVQFQFRVRIAGADQEVNANTVVYQYIAVSDPSMRFLITGTIAHKDTDTATINKLPVEGFVPQFMHLIAEGTTAVTTKRLYLKGPAQAAGNITNFSPAAPLAGVTFGTGQFTSDAALHALTTSQAWAVWRRSDGLSSPTEAAVVAFGSYTGDGSASRTISISPAPNRRPVFVQVYAETSSSGCTRDPSHTGSNSATHTGANTTTGITTGQVDGFSVGALLNSNGVNYGWFALFAIEGCTGNNGFGCNGEHIPTEPESPGGTGPWPTNPGPPEEPEEPDGGDGEGFPGGDPGDEPDFSDLCAPWTTHLVNVALSRIGIGKQISDIATDVSEEAYKARLNFRVVVEAVLRDFPWAFATRYADLVLVDGAEDDWVNKDWKYAYRAPTNMVRARRIVSQELEQRGPDPDPPQFRIGTDGTGYLIYTNVPITAADANGLGAIPVQLEYTARMACPAQQGDPLFREALIWRVAENLALPLARDTEKAKYCRAQYEAAILAAKEVVANEEQKTLETSDAPWIRER